MKGTCKWHEDVDSWVSGCGHRFEFIAGGPVENGFLYCPFCMLPIELVADDFNSFFVKARLNLQSEPDKEKGE